MLHHLCWHRIDSMTVVHAMLLYARESVDHRTCGLLGMASHFMPMSPALCTCSPKDDIAAYMKENEELA